jgi:hypothetical protein
MPFPLLGCSWCKLAGMLKWVVFEAEVAASPALRAGGYRPAVVPIGATIAVSLWLSGSRLLVYTREER